jgi:Holliday junction resolvase RusA-like endonuclease
MKLTFEIPLEPRTKKNSAMIAGIGSRCPFCGKFKKQFIRQGRAHDIYVHKALPYVKPIPEKPIDTPVHIKYLFYMGTHRIVDKLNLQAAADDLLVMAGVLKDDNSRIVVSHDGSRVLYDKERPRTEIIITDYEGDEEYG